MRFSYAAKEADGAVVEGFVEAPDERTAVRKLSAEGVRVIDLRPTEIAKQQRRARAVRSGDLEQPLQELAILLSGGVQALPACESVARSSVNPAIAAAFERLGERLKTGESFSVAFAAVAPAASPAVKAIIRAGDATGSLALAIKEAAETMGFQGALQREIIAALVYPAILFIAGIGAALFMALNIVPRFAETLGERVAKLPAFTQAIFASSLWLKDNVGLVLAASFGIVTFVIQLARSPTLRANAFDALLYVPFVRSFLLAFESARWSGLFAAMIARKTPLLDAFTIAREGLVSGRIGRQLREAERAIRRGQSIARSLQAYTIFPATLINLVAAGEASGDLAGAARNAAVVFQERSRGMGKQLAALVEPATVLLIGLFVGTLAVTMLTAINSVTASGL
jgi:type II secretory pathway component PulF